VPAARGAYRVEGIRTLRRHLKRAGVDLQDLKDTHKKIADEVIEEARRRAPVSNLPTRGRLRDSLRPAGYAASAVVRASGRTVPYANPIHWGWPSRHIKPNPFVLDAAESQWGEVNNMYLHAIESIIAEVEGDTTR
jgi:hypothetical protein